MKNDIVNNTNAVRTELGQVESAPKNGITKGHAEVHNTKLYFERAGTGRTLVLLHAGIADHRMWDTQFHTFADNYDVIRYDLRGYGKSNLEKSTVHKRPQQNNSPDDKETYSHSQDLYLLLRTLGVESATLIGSSLGGATAVDFALEQPTMTDGLVLVGAVPSGYQFDGEIPETYKNFQKAVEQNKTDHAAELATQIWFDGPERKPNQVDTAVRTQVKEMITEVISRDTIDFAGDNAEAEPAVDRLGEIVAPVLVMFGDSDDANVQEAANLLANEIPAADRRQIDGAAHFPNLERPDLFYATVSDFLERTAMLDQEADLATGLGGAVERKLVAPEPVNQS